jgi:hypothetical protein
VASVGGAGAPAPPAAGGGGHHAHRALLNAQVRPGPGIPGARRTTPPLSPRPGASIHGRRHATAHKQTRETAANTPPKPPPQVNSLNHKLERLASQHASLVASSAVQLEAIETGASADARELKEAVLQLAAGLAPTQRQVLELTAQVRGGHLRGPGAGAGVGGTEMSREGGCRSSSAPATAS